ncbi:MAG: quinone oxidoreductase [Acidobacteria bacterium]|nr:quinone oxidoreductase [Acidobacteriota bacterium]
MKAIRVRETGGPEKLSYEDMPLPSPAAGQARILIQSIGLNFIDVYFRTGLYKAALPFTPGMEAAGIVEAVGEGVDTVKVGDRVAYAGTLGAYAEFSLVSAAHLVVLPDEVDFESAAALMLQGITAHYLTHSTFPLRKGETLLLHAAAGGVGLLLIQIAAKIGAKVIGTVSTEDKAALARDAGADHIIFYTRDDFEQEVKRITAGAGVDVVYDSVGRTTFEKSLNCLKRRGMMVLFGQSSGSVPAIEPGILNAKGSLYLTRPGLAHYTATREELMWRAGDILKWVSQKSLKIHIAQTFPLKEASKAHQALEGRKTAGKVLLHP